jgi:hypothetical protein
MFGISWLAYVLFVLGFAAIAFACLSPHRSIVEEEEDRVPVSEARPAMLELPIESRLGMIEDLASIREAWCGPVLVSAYVEEPEPRAREAILCALREARYRDCAVVLEAAARSVRIEERVLAVELADAVDEEPAIDAALEDPEPAVAAAAVYALKKRYNGTLLMHLEERVSRERADMLLSHIRALA